MAEDFDVPATGPDIYRCFVIPTNLPEDAYISAIEYRPGNRRVVHHLLAFVDTSGGARKQDAADPGPGYTCFSGPGRRGPRRPRRLGAGQRAQPPPRRASAGRCPAQSDVLMQVHYHPSGKPEVDRTRIGLHFCTDARPQTLHWANATNDDVQLPPGESNIEVKAVWNVPVDVEALGRHPAHAPARQGHADVRRPSPTAAPRT